MTNNVIIRVNVRNVNSANLAGVLHAIDLC